MVQRFAEHAFGLGLHLADAFPCQTEIVPNLHQGASGLAPKPVPLDDNLSKPRRQLIHGPKHGRSRFRNVHA